MATSSDGSLINRTIPANHSVMVAAKAIRITLFLSNLVNTNAKIRRSKRVSVNVVQSVVVAMNFMYCLILVIR